MKYQHKGENSVKSLRPGPQQGKSIISEEQSVNLDSKQICMTAAGKEE